MKKADQGRANHPVGHNSFDPTILPETSGGEQEKSCYEQARKGVAQRQLDAKILFALTISFR
jgi:hypothetical protein